MTITWSSPSKADDHIVHLAGSKDLRTSTVDCGPRESRHLELVTCDFLHDKLVVIDVTGKGQRVANNSLDYISREYISGFEWLNG